MRFPFAGRAGPLPEPHADELAYALRSHVKAHGGPCKVYEVPFSVNLRGDGPVFVEPDISAVYDSSKLSDRGCEGAPDLVVEVVSPTSWKLDYFRKASLHESAGVRERWIAKPRSRQIHIYQAGRAAGVRPGADRAAGRPRRRA